MGWILGVRGQLWPHQTEGGASARTGFHLNRPLMDLDDFFDHGQAHSPALSFLVRIEGVEHFEDRFMVFRRNTGPIIGDAQHCPQANILSGNDD